MKGMILTLDISSKAVGYAIYQDCLLESGTLTAGKKYAGSIFRIPEIAHQFRRIIALHSHIDVYVEQPFYMPGASHDTPIKMMHGAILTVLHDIAHVQQWQQVNVSTWRKTVFDRGNLTSKECKKLAIARAQERWEKKVKDDDEADALCILEHVLQLEE
jgi:hypothetical protein